MTNKYNILPGVDPFNSEGFELNYIENEGEIIEITPRQGFVNQHNIIDSSYTNRCLIFNRKDRISSPLHKKDGKWYPLSIDEAVALIRQKMSAVSPIENAIFASPESTNEILYLIQKWARAGVKSNALHSFHYLKDGDIFNQNKNDILPMHEMMESKQIFVIGSNLQQEHSHIHQLIQKRRNEEKIPTIFITEIPMSPYQGECDNTLLVRDLHTFFYTVNLYIIKNNLQFGIFTNGLALRYEEFLQQMQNENLEEYYLRAGVSEEIVKSFVKQVINIPKSAFILSEKSCSASTFLELKNMMFLTEKQAKSSSGIMLLKRCCNSQGLFDMGFIPQRGAGNREFDEEYIKILQELWQCESPATEPHNIFEELKNGIFKNLFIFGENPAQSDSELFKLARKNAQFLCVQAHFMNETCEMADLILPQNFALEIGGSYSNCFKAAVNFEAVKASPIAWNEFHFWTKMHNAFNITPLQNSQEVFLETISLFAPSCCGGIRHKFSLTKRPKN